MVDGIEHHTVFEWNAPCEIGYTPSCIVGDEEMCFVSFGTMLQGLIEKGIRLERDFDFPIVSLACDHSILVIALREGWIYVLDCHSFAMLGTWRYRWHH